MSGPTGASTGPAAGVGPARPVVHVVGLGPGGPDLVTAGTLALIERVPTRFLRTTRHPAAAVMDGDASFDHLYESATTMEGVYRGIVEALVRAAGDRGEVLYAVPGSPVVAEHTVELLLADERVRAVCHPALSFLDLTWVRLGVDPVERGRGWWTGTASAWRQRGSAVRCSWPSATRRSCCRTSSWPWTNRPVRRWSSCNGWACPTRWSSRWRGRTWTARWIRTTSRRSGSRSWPSRWRPRWRASTSSCATSVPRTRGRRSRPTTRSSGSCWRRPTRCSRRSTPTTPPPATAPTTCAASWATCCTRWCSTPRSVPRRGGSPWPTWPGPSRTS